MRLNGHELIQILPLAELYTDYRNHRRLTVFVHKGRECIGCGRLGVLLLKTVDKGGGVHVDLYTDDFVLITVDHIVPKKTARGLGWSKKEIESLDNKQTMCDPCNNKKGHLYVGSKQVQLPPRRTGTEVIRELVFNENVFSRRLDVHTV